MCGISRISTKRQCPRVKGQTGKYLKDTKERSLFKHPPQLEENMNNLHLKK